MDRTGLGFIREKERPHKTGKARGFPFQMKQVSLSHTQALFFNFELGEREKENDHRKREKSLASSVAHLRNERKQDSDLSDLTL